MKRAILYLSIICLVAVTSSCGDRDNKTPDGKDHDVTITVNPDSMAPGEKGKITINLSAFGIWHLNEEAVAIVTLAPPEGVTVPKTELDEENRKSVSEYVAELQVEGDAKPGPRTMGVEVYFMLCTEDKCKFVQEEHKVDFRVK